MKIEATIFLLLFQNSVSNLCHEKPPIVITTQARGRLGNHLWILMTLLAFKLKSPEKVDYYLPEESKLILSKYFDNFEDIKTVEDLCGFNEFHDHFVNYTDQKILDYFESKSGQKIVLQKPESKYATSRLVIPSDIYHKYPLNGDAFMNTQEFIDNYSPTKYKIHNCSFEWQLFREPPEALYDIQDPNSAFLLYPGGGASKNGATGKFFSQVPNLASELLKLLKLKAEYRAQAQEKLTQIKTKFKNQSKEFVFVGIHSRRTDHFSVQKKHGWKPVTPSYFLDAMDLARAQFKKKYNLAFVFVSDDMKWAKEKIGQKKGGQKNVFYLGSDNDALDLALLAACNHTIQSYGSFTYFAGFLANGVKIIPQHFAEYRTGVEKNSKTLKSNPFEKPIPKLYFLDSLE